MVRKQGLRDRCGAPFVRDDVHNDNTQAPWGSGLDAIAYTDTLAGFDVLIVDPYMTTGASFGGLASMLEEACSPEPFIDTCGVHGPSSLADIE
jgi:hypothetical protein